MLRYGLAFTILALTGALLTLPGPVPAKAAFRPAFTGGPFRIVLPGFGAHRFGRGGPRRAGAIHRPMVGGPVPQAVPGHPAVHNAADGPSPFRILRHQRIGRSVYSVTVGADAAFYGAPYDPSDGIPVYAPLPVLADPLAPVLSQQVPAADEPRGCRAEHVIVPSASGRGEGNVTIVRC